jgi:pilus assembly protein CpaF
LIRDFIDEEVPNENVEKILGLDAESEPSDHVMYEIIMYRYKKRYGKDAMTQWIRKNNFARERIATGSDREQDKAYYITIEDLQQSYLAENINLTIEEKKDVLAVLVYQLYKGFGIIDTLREMNINGFNLGTSGSILSATTSKNAVLYRANSSCWIYFEGKYIHLRFMNFGTEDELKRIIRLLIRFNNPGALTAKRGYLVNTMYDKSRILALRPPASEYWAVFVRKFTLKDVRTESLIIKDYTVNGGVAVKLIELLMRGQVTTAVTGRQGSGKTTLMTAMMAYIDPRYTIRVLEMAPELYLRELYPTRNILSVQETLTVSAAELQDALKKSDAAVSIVGEVATDAIAARMIQMGMTASIFTIFSHHANTPKDLVLTL